MKRKHCFSDQCFTYQYHTELIAIRTPCRPRFINGKEEHESLPIHLKQMFTLLEENDFRVDISSTELRKIMEAAGC